MSYITAALIVRMYQCIVFAVEVAKILMNVFVLGKDEDTFSKDWGHSLSGEELQRGLGLKGTAIQIFEKQGGRLITEHFEQSPEYWTTTFLIDPLKSAGDPVYIAPVKDRIYTVNHFYFEDSRRAEEFYKMVKASRDKAYRYDHNGPAGKKESISGPILRGGTTVIITYGK
jgi:hypothetical protein